MEGVALKMRLFWALKWHEQSECYLGPKTTGTLIVILCVFKNRCEETVTVHIHILDKNENLLTGLVTLKTFLFTGGN